MQKFDFSVIRNLRKKRGLTAEGLAKTANLTRATISKIEGGNANPTIETVEALSSVFQLSSSELIRLAEVAQCEAANTRFFETENLEGAHIWFPNFEIYHIRAGADVRKEADPERHENTAEVLSGAFGQGQSDRRRTIAPIGTRHGVAIQSPARASL